MVWSVPNRTYVPYACKYSIYLHPYLHSLQGLKNNIVLLEIGPNIIFQGLFCMHSIFTGRNTFCFKSWLDK